ncbi:hypothetical protein FRB99_007249, partial [Tulasnella sp. 403]
MTTTLDYDIVDAFASSPFSGNPAAVIIIPEDIDLPDSTLQKIAAEFNLSETAFLNFKQVKPPSQTVLYGLRWFTPMTEVPLCGHATLACARVIFSAFLGDVQTLEFDTLSGRLTARRLPGLGGKIELEFPETKLTPLDGDDVATVAEVVSEAFGGPVTIHSAQDAGMFVLIHVDRALDLENAVVKTDAFLKLPKYVIVTSDRPSAITPSARFISRMFAPQAGIPEDPVCGSAHCALAPYWSQALGVPSGDVISARQ